MNKIIGDDDFWAGFSVIVKQRIYIAKDCITRRI